MEKYFWETMISAVVAYLVPKFLGGLGDTFTFQPTDSERKLPVGPWLLAAFLGGAIGGAISAAMGDQGMVNWAIYGASLGIMQWFALRTYLPVGGWWALASALGWALAGLYLPPFAGGMLVGLVIGGLQVMGLSAEGKSWWIVGNMVAWTLTVYLTLAVLMPLVAPLGPVMGWLVGWGLVALLGHLFLLWPLSKLRWQKPKEKGD